LLELRKLLIEIHALFTVHYPLSTV
jgi:hypothetical protein